MTPAPEPARLLVRLLMVGGGLALAGITLASPGATRMHATPWNLVGAVALLAPALALVGRAADPREPLRLPARWWSATALGWVVLVLAAALASPFRGPSLLAAAPLLAPVAVFFLVCDGASRLRAARADFWRAWLLASAVVAGTSLALWVIQVTGSGGGLEARNPYPLGHSNYTAGLALLMLPAAAVVAWCGAGRARLGAGSVVLLALALLFTSGSRGGFLGLGALGLAALWQVPLPRRRKLQFAALLAGLAALVVVAHPRTRATVFGGAEAHLVAASEVQRTAMATAGLRLGADRPLTGWGPGTVPLAYPRYRAALPGGAENVLQLHSLPVQVWAEIGGGGLVWLAVAAILVGRGWRREPVAAITLFGYGVFALTDWQLDVPVFAFAVAALAAWVAVGEGAAAEEPAVAARPSRWLAGGLGALALGVILLVGFGGGRDRAPELNVRALALARDPARAGEAIALLRESLAENPDQEIAHFNLGWLLLVREPAAAEGHFRAAARLVPDKGGVYFGIGLARLNQGRPAEAARALALECLNDPQFLRSPWWREPALAAIREAAAAAFAAHLRRVAGVAPPHRLDPQWLGRVPEGPERVYRRERTGYPVLMRNLDLPPPQDLYDVRETTVPPPVPLPPKGWLPSPLLLALLDEPVSPRP